MNSQREFDAVSGVQRIVELKERIIKPVLVAIAGGTCSGKTFLSGKVEAAAKERNESATIAALDDFYKDISDPDFPRDNLGNSLFDVLESYHQGEFRVAIVKLMAGQDVFFPNYNVVTNKRLPKHKYRRSSVNIITEGLYVIEALKNFQRIIKVFVYADEDIILERRVKRDTLLYKVTEETVRETFKKKVFPYYRKFIEPQKDQADIIIKSQ